MVNRREGKPPPGNGYSGEFCMELRNRAPFTITGRVQIKSRDRKTFRLSRNQSRQLCFNGMMYGNNTVSLVITNFMTLPLFSCYTMVYEPVVVRAYRHQDGWLYDASCRK